MQAVVAKWKEIWGKISPVVNKIEEHWQLRYILNR